jgi:nucleoside-diphosphate kinase
MNTDFEQTLVLIKPDALKNSLTGYVLSQLSEFHTGLRFSGAKIVHVNRILAEEHYAEHRGKVFYPSLIDNIMGLIHHPEEPHKRRVVAFVYQGRDAVRKIRDIAGPTNPHVARDKRPGCIRALGTTVILHDGAGNVIGERMDNLIHASASVPEAEREIKLWFHPTDIPPSMRIYPVETCDRHYYFGDGRLSATHGPGMLSIVGPGDIAWKSDLDLLRALELDAPLPPSSAFNAVVAKYLINCH